MRLEYRVILDLDDAKLKEDRPAENVGQTIQEEIASHLASLEKVLGIVGVTVSPASIPCECDGGEQGEGCVSIPHEPHCPRYVADGAAAHD